MSIKQYVSELGKSKSDHKIVTDHALVLTVTPIVEDYGIPMTADVKWSMQHWRAMPKPKLGSPDHREFGYFSWDGKKLTYRVIPADNIEIEKGVEIIPLQTRRVHVAKRVPSAVNYFPNSEITRDPNRDVYLLKGV